MKRYTFITDYECGKDSRVLTIYTDDVKQAEIYWISTLDFPQIGDASKKRLKKMLSSNTIYSSRLKNIREVSCIYTKINGKSIESYIIEHKDLIVSNLFIYIVIVLYKGGTFVRRVFAPDQHYAIKLWAKYLSWHFYDKQERDCIKNTILKNLIEPITEVERTVWSNRFYVLGYEINIFLIKL